MPTYTYECFKCGRQRTEILKLAEHVTFRPKHCKRPMYQVIAAPQIVTDIQPYRSMITGERVAGRAQHHEHLKRHDCIEVGNEQPHAARPRTVSKTSRREVLHKQLADVSDKQATKILKQLKKDLHV